jgi:transposase
VSSPLGRRLHSLGHTVKLMAPQFVKPYVNSNKTDAADAEAICEFGARVCGLARCCPSAEWNRRVILLS